MKKKKDITVIHPDTGTKISFSLDAAEDLYTTLFEALIGRKSDGIYRGVSYSIEWDGGDFFDCAIGRFNMTARTMSQAVRACESHIDLILQAYLTSTAPVKPGKKA